MKIIVLLFIVIFIVGSLTNQLELWGTTGQRKRREKKQERARLARIELEKRQAELEIIESLCQTIINTQSEWIHTGPTWRHPNGMELMDDSWPYSNYQLYGEAEIKFNKNQVKRIEEAFTETIMNSKMNHIKKLRDELVPEQQAIDDAIEDLKKWTQEP